MGGNEVDFINDLYDTWVVPTGLTRPIYLRTPLAQRSGKVLILKLGQFQVGSLLCILVNFSAGVDKRPFPLPEQKGPAKIYKRAFHNTNQLNFSIVSCFSAAVPACLRNWGCCIKPKLQPKVCHFQIVHACSCSFKDNRVMVLGSQYLVPGHTFIHLVRYDMLPLHACKYNIFEEKRPLPIWSKL